MGQVVEEIVEIAKIISQERVQQRTVEQVVDVPVPQVVEEIVEIAKIIPQERVQQRTVEQVVDVPVPQVVEEIGLNRFQGAQSCHARARVRTEEGGNSKNDIRCR